MVRATNDDVLVSVEPWEEVGHNGSRIDVLAVQFERVGFTLTLPQVQELCGKLGRLGRGEDYLPEEGGTVFVDLDRTTRETPFVTLGAVGVEGHPSWFCDIPETAARQLHVKLAERLRQRKGRADARNTVAGFRQENLTP